MENNKIIIKNKHLDMLQYWTFEEGCLIVMKTQKDINEAK